MSERMSKSRIAALVVLLLVPVAMAWMPPRATPPAATGPATSTGCGGRPTPAACEQCCLDQHLAVLRDAREICVVCDFNFLGWCLSESLIPGCFSGIKSKAEGVFASCNASCQPDDEEEEGSEGEHDEAHRRP